MLRHTYLSLAILAFTVAEALSAQEIIDISGRQYLLDCAGQPSGPVVILLPGGDGSIESWQKVQDSVARFTRACSYEPAGSAQRGDPGRRQTMDQMADDLDRVLSRTVGPTPVVLVGHNAGGVLARRFAARFPGRVAAFVFVDSSHEEQMWRFAEIAPNLITHVFGPDWNAAAVLGPMGLLPRGQRSSWHTDRPMMVLEHGTPDPVPPGVTLTPVQASQLETTWHVMQKDLAARSPKGQLKTALGVGTLIHRQSPALVVTAIRDILRTSR